MSRYSLKTDIYKISKIIKGLQLLTTKNVIRIWNDELVKEANEKNGKLIIKNIIDNQ